jgi:hypothetical protein
MSPLRLAPLLVALAACNPSLPERSTSGLGAGPSVEIDPPAPLDEAPAVLRIRASFPGASIDPAGVALVQGTVGPAHLRQLQKGQPSQALTKRMVPVTAWQDPGGEAVILAPTAPLEAGEIYSVANGDPPMAVEIRITASDGAPLLRRIWPPEGAAATAGFAVWCGDAPVPDLDVPAAIEPSGPVGRIRRGATPEATADGCVRFEAQGDPSAGGGAPPPSIEASDGTLLRLDPRPFTLDGAAVPIAPLACDPDEIALGPGCARVADDRLYGRSPDAPLLWVIAGAGVEHAFAAAPGDPFVVSPLPPSTAITLRIAAIDNGGAASQSIVSVVTRDPMPHLVLNEVLANPVGPEPAGEWIEIVNDGSAPAELGGHVLVDVGGETPLPSGVLPPGGFALLANEAFLEQNDFDPAPAPGTLILRVPKLAKNGLSNDGEPLQLLDAQGRVVSRAPALASKPGQSVARRTPDAPDGLLASFAVANPSPGHPNVW